MERFAKSYAPFTTNWTDDARYYLGLGKQAVANYAVHYMLHLLGEDDLIKKRIEERTSVTTGTQILAWKDA